MFCWKKLTVRTGAGNLSLEGAHQVSVHQHELPQACPYRHPLLRLGLGMLAKAVVEALQDLVLQRLQRLARNLPQSRLD